MNADLFWRINNFLALNREACIVTHCALWESLYHKIFPKTQRTKEYLQKKFPKDNMQPFTLLKNLPIKANIPSVTLAILIGTRRDTLSWPSVFVNGMKSYDIHMQGPLCFSFAPPYFLFVHLGNGNKASLSQASICN